MSDTLRKPLHRTRGQAMVEFAFILPLLLIFMSLIIDFGYYLFSRITVNSAVRNATRLASLNKSTSTAVAQRVKDAAIGVNIPSGAITVTVRNSDSSFAGSPPSVTVLCTYTHTFFLAPDRLIGFTGLACGSTFTMQITTYTGNASPSFSSGTF